MRKLPDSLFTAHRFYRGDKYSACRGYEAQERLINVLIDLWFVGVRGSGKADHVECDGPKLARKIRGVVIQLQWSSVVKSSII